MFRALLACLLTHSVAAHASPPEFRGELEIEAVQKFISSHPTPPSELIVSSPGGDLIAGMLLGLWIYKHSIDVVVDGICASSCANYVFSAGALKKISPGGLVLYHGGAQQADFTDYQNSYLLALVRQYFKRDSREDRRLLLGSERFDNLILYQRLEARFFSVLKIDPALPTIGQCGQDVPPLWTLSSSAMSSLGLENVVADASYGSFEYLERWRKSHSSTLPKTSSSAIRVLDAKSVVLLRSSCAGVADGADLLQELLHAGK